MAWGKEDAIIPHVRKWRHRKWLAVWNEGQLEELSCVWRGASDQRTLYGKDLSLIIFHNKPSQKKINRLSLMVSFLIFSLVNTQFVISGGGTLNKAASRATAEDKFYILSPFTPCTNCSNSREKREEQSSLQQLGGDKNTESLFISSCSEPKFAIKATWTEVDPRLSWFDPRSLTESIRLLEKQKMPGRPT